MKLLNAKQLAAAVGGSVWWIYGLKRSARYLGDSPFLSGERYSTVERFEAWLRRHPDFAAASTPPSHPGEVKPTNEPTQKMKLLNSSQLAEALGVSSQWIGALKKAAETKGDSPFLGGRYSTVDRIMSWLDAHRDFVANHTDFARKLDRSRAKSRGLVRWGEVIKLRTQPLICAKCNRPLEVEYVDTPQQLVGKSIVCPNCRTRLYLNFVYKGASAEGGRFKVEVDVDQSPIRNRLPPTKKREG